MEKKERKKSGQNKREKSNIVEQIESIQVALVQKSIE
jgi:hypothetical protein